MRGQSAVIWTSAILVCFVNGAACSAETGVATAPDFRDEVAPILQAKCVECHDASMQMAELRLDSRQAMVEAGVLVPGDADNSTLVQRLKDRELGILMPPTGRLDQAEIEVLTKWVDTGAAWPESATLSPPKAAGNGDHLSEALFAAIRANDIPVLKQELRDTQLVQARDRHGATPLMHAALYASAESVQLLLDYGADPNATDEDGLTPLMYAAGSDPAKTRLLLDRGAKVDTQSKLGRTVLLMASAFAGNNQVVKALLDAGADVNYADRRKWTATVLAARTGDVGMVRTLLDAGGEINGGNSQRLSPGTPLMQAAWASDLACSKLLLDRGAKADPRSVNSALIFASTHGSREILALLLDAGADPRANIVTNYVPESPILAAAYSDSLNAEVVKTLLERGVDTQQQDNRGETPLSLAAQRGPSEIVALLQSSKPNETKVAGPAAEESASFNVSQQAIKQVVQKSVSLLESCGPKFFASSGCTACHQQTAASLLVQMARARGLDVDEQLARQQTKLTAVDLSRSRAAYLQRMKSGGTAHRLGYLLWGLAAADYPADEITDAAYVELAGLQLHNGSWVSDAHRPPSEYSPITATAVSLHAVQLYHPPGHSEQAGKRVARATEWLISAPARANAEKAFRLLGLHWGGADRAHLASAKDALLKDQASNGGWSQLPSMEPDAYATGLTLYALGQSGTVSVVDPAYRKGIAFLMKTVKNDGSWHVSSRSFKFQPYFESGFPYEHDQWISAAATGWAAMALLQTIEPTDDAESVSQAFVEYPAPVAAYLRRLHGKDDLHTAGALAFRVDYPGGFRSWQRDTRKKLVELLGLDRIRPLTLLPSSFD